MPALRRQKESPASLVADFPHIDLAITFANLLAAETGQRPVYTLGGFWVVDAATGLWQYRSEDLVALDVGRRLAGAKLCRRGSDYKQISRLLATLLERASFFNEAAAGIAAGGKFYRVTQSGEIAAEPLTADHRQRFAVAAAPDFEAEAPLFDTLLTNAFGAGAEGDGQRELLQMLFGAVLVRTLHRYRIVGLLHGPTSTGKSTLLTILQSFFPPDLVGATSPQRWDHEYFVAALALKVLNVVGELDPKVQIPGGPFKAVTGGDVVEGRHPNHRPITFVCLAGHIFNCNRLPPTVDRSDAFFRRWRIFEFANPIQPGREIVGLAERIIAEEQGAVLAWLLDGAAKLAQRGAFPETAQHKRLMTRWRAANNMALLFLTDGAECELAPEHRIRGMDMFVAFERWVRESGIKGLGRNGFYEALEDGAGRLGVRVFNDGDGIKQVEGVSLVRGL